MMNMEGGDPQFLVLQTRLIEMHAINLVSTISESTPIHGQKTNSIRTNVRITLAKRTCCYGQVSRALMVPVQR